MKKSLYCFIPAVLVIASVAHATDLPPRAFTKAPIVAPAFSWTGFYIGAHAGYVDATSNASAADTLAISTTYGRMPHPRGGFAGLQAGYNYQYANNVVVGVEGGVDGLGIDGLKDNLGIPPGSSLSVTTNWGFSLVGRAGYAFGPWLPYAFIGANWVHDKETGFNPFIGAFALQNTHSGWTTGAGLEYAFARSWSGRLQYRYIDVDRQQYNARSVGGTSSGVDAAINYHF